VAQLVNEKEYAKSKIGKYFIGKGLIENSFPM
jgi:hypothetical protein